ncbi:cyclic nucleotide-binding domain protein, putative (macronuclear) [Tetrahymena thermophila SB210]|uniref:Cyclic nucleotide-binding domain protein, putative n=1 Tax=Tetrahymena thermophila (strain SB210) TaxID=312017 RepID=W7X8A7_TETTS|nr:cyclic nucleotide-binding domain protein, putative [Tetrahymena thermophila SB210]EWS72638.1 cyclic nucleotide-binding domain protein, putative [Tetrahymena thermophila SB210]|eukprot:XP_012654806.1 cyclic nucleotide-binding domain protein, putative [Tetrahymena thermophila SB210]
MYRLESITSNYYNEQLQLSVKLVEIQIQKLLSQTQISPKFQITNLIQLAQNDFQQFSSRLNKKDELEEIHACITKNFKHKDFETKQNEDLLDRLKLITNFDQYEYLQNDIQENKSAISMRYSPQYKQLQSQLSSFSDSLIPYIKYANDTALFDQLLPSKMFYENNFRVIMNKYFSSGESLVNLQFRQTDERFFKKPPFLQEFQFKNLLSLSVNVDSLDFKNLIIFVQNHPQLQSLDILLNVDQQLIATSNLRSLFSSQILPNIQKLKIDIARLNFSNSVQINDIYGFFQPIQLFLNQKRNSIQNFEIDGLIEFNNSIEEFQSLFFNQQNQIMSHLRKLTFLVADIDFQYNQQKIMLKDLHQNIFSQMPILQQIKLYKSTEYLDIQRFFQMLNQQLKIKTYLIKLLMLIKSRLKFFRKEIIYSIIEDYIRTISNMIKINTF